MSPKGAGWTTRVPPFPTLPLKVAPSTSAGSVGMADVMLGGKWGGGLVS